MATTRGSGRFVLPASADLSSNQYYVVVESSGEVALASAATDNILGVLQNAPVAGDNAEVLGRHANETGKVIAGGTIAVGDKLTTNGDGKAVTTTTANDQVFGIARKAAVANDIVEYEPTRQLV